MPMKQRRRFFNQSLGLNGSSSPTRGLGKRPIFSSKSYGGIFWKTNPPAFKQLFLVRKKNKNRFPEMHGVHDILWISVNHMQQQKTQNLQNKTKNISQVAMFSIHLACQVPLPSIMLASQSDDSNKSVDPLLLEKY